MSASISADGPCQVLPEVAGLHRNNRQRIVQLMGHTGQQRAHGRQLFALDEGLLLLLQMGGSALAFHHPAQLRANLRYGLQEG